MLQKTSLLYRLQKSVFRFIGDIKCSGIKNPFWFTINAKGYKLLGEHYRMIHGLLKPGDILLRRCDSYLDSFLIPGFFIHAGIYIGKTDLGTEQVIHSISEGVIEEDILNFLRTDHMVILRLKDENSDKINSAIQAAKKIVGSPYDFNFDFANCDRFSCTELVSFCYPNLFQPRKRFNKNIIIADDIFACSDLQVVWDSRKIEETGKSVVECYFFKKEKQNNLSG